MTHRDTIVRGDFYPYNPHATYDVAPDGTHLLLLTSVTNAEWVVVYNWAAEFRKKLRGR